MRTSRSAVLAALSMGALVAGGATSAMASSDGGSGETTGSRPGAFRAASYINPDGGDNPNVNSNSSCSTPDQYDRQRTSSRASGDPGNRNVHNDACFLGDGYSSSWRYNERDRRVDGPATFESLGTGYISACPDPDNGGPKVAITRDTDGDGRVDFCFQSGYQEKGVAGDREFHARMNNDSEPGDQTVVWCYDPDRDGCDDEDIKDVVNVRWTDGGQS